MFRKTKQKNQVNASFTTIMFAQLGLPVTIHNHVADKNFYLHQYLVEIFPEDWLELSI